jgi:hypothetical protein
MLFCVQTSFGMGEAYIVKEQMVAFENKTIKIPQVYSTIPNDTNSLKKVNDKIIERFNLIPNAPANREEFEDFVGTLQFFEDQAGYLDITYAYTMKDDFLEIVLEGDYAEFEGKPLFEIFQTYKKETFYVDLVNREVFDAVGYENDIKLRNYFEPEDYLKLLCATWVPRIGEVKKKYPDDKEYELACEDCSSNNAFLRPFTFEYELEADGLTFSLNRPAYYRNVCFQSFCSPQLTLRYPIEEVAPLFKSSFDFSDYMRLDDNLSKVIFYKKTLEEERSNTKLISGRVNDKYPFLMEFAIDPSGDVSGHYMYTSKCQLLEIRGKVKVDGKIELSEWLNNEVTGHFLIAYVKDMANEYQIKQFDWYSPDKSKSYHVVVDDFEIY